MRLEWPSLFVCSSFGRGVCLCIHVQNENRGKKNVQLYERCTNTHQNHTQCRYDIDREIRIVIIAQLFTAAIT